MEKRVTNFRTAYGTITHSDGDVLEGMYAKLSSDHGPDGAREEIEPPGGKATISTLAHGLERVLFKCVNTFTVVFLV